jgi:hypothetical protein
LAKFPRLRELRETRLGWEVTELANKLPNGRPSISSIYRLEQGFAIRFASAKRVFDVIESALGEKLDATKELIRG